MSTEWFVERDEGVAGPYTASRLKALVVDGKVRPTDLIRKGTDGKPVPASSVKGLIEAPPQRTSAPPPLPTRIRTEHVPPTANLADLRREIASLRQTVLSYVLDESVVLPRIPAVDTFRRDRSQLLSEIEAARIRIGNVEAARDRYVAASDHLEMAKGRCDQARKDLAKLYRPLGASAFADFQMADHSQPQAEFASRIAIQQRIVSLQKEYDSLAPRHERGLVGKVKAKAQQLAVAAKLKAEELKASRCDEVVGRRLAETGKADSLIGERAANIAQQIAAAKADLAAASEHLETAQREFQRTTERISRCLPLERIDGVVAFNREISSLYTRIKSQQSESDRLDERLPEHLLPHIPAFAGTPIASSFPRLQTAIQALREAERLSLAHKIKTSLVSIATSVHTLPRRAKVGIRTLAIRTAAIVGLILAVVAILGLLALLAARFDILNRVRNTRSFANAAPVLPDPTHAAVQHPKGAAGNVQQPQQIVQVAEPVERPKITHDPFTTIAIPPLGPTRTHDLNGTKDDDAALTRAWEHPDYKPSTPVVVADLETVDFLKGPLGEPIETERMYYGTDLRYQYYFYCTKKGEKVRHGPWTWFTKSGDKTVGSLYVHGVAKTGVDYHRGVRPVVLEQYRGDNDHNRTEYEYAANGELKIQRQYRIVHKMTLDGEQQVKEKHGTWQLYYDNSGIDRIVQGLERSARSSHDQRYQRYLYDRIPVVQKDRGRLLNEQIFENGKSVGMAQWTREGELVLSLGVLKDVYGPARSP